MSKCIICNCLEYEILVKWKQYEINRCRDCQLIFATPLPSDAELHAFYQGFLFKKPEKKEIQKRIEKRKKELQQLFGLSKEVEKHPKKKFLDFGGGTGVAYKAASELGLISYYQDIDKQSEKFTRDNLGLTADYIVDDIERTNVRFDLIFSDNVIEHVKNPSDFVKNLLAVLKEGGTLVIKTPHAANTEMYLNPVISLKNYALTALKYNSLGKAIKGYFTRFWNCDPPRHLYSFSENSFHKMMLQPVFNHVNYEILYYQIPMFVNTITKAFFTKDKVLSPWQSVLVRLVLLPILPIEVCLQLLKWGLLKLNLISPGGIILKIHKHQ